MKKSKENIIERPYLCTPILQKVQQNTNTTLNHSYKVSNQSIGKARKLQKPANHKRKGLKTIWGQSRNATILTISNELLDAGIVQHVYHVDQMARHTFLFSCFFYDRKQICCINTTSSTILTISNEL